MANYQARLDRIEAEIAPDPTMHLVWVNRDETNEQAAERYAVAHGLPVAKALARAAFLSWRDAKL